MITSLFSEMSQTPLGDNIVMHHDIIITVSSLHHHHITHQRCRFVKANVPIPLTVYLKKANYVSSFCRLDGRGGGGCVFCVSAQRKAAHCMHRRQTQRGRVLCGRERSLICPPSP